MCNYRGNRFCCDAADRAMQSCGGIGYGRKMPFEHIYRHHRRYRITEGAEEIQIRKVAGKTFGYSGRAKGIRAKVFGLFKRWRSSRRFYRCEPQIRCLTGTTWRGVISDNPIARIGRVEERDSWSTQKCLRFTEALAIARLPWSRTIKKLRYPVAQCGQL